MAAAESHQTKDHDTIRRWAEERGGQPATVKRTKRGEEPGMLTIDFPGYGGGESLEHISWDEWFRKFDEKNLVFVYQETTAQGEKSNFNRLIFEETARRREER